MLSTVSISIAFSLLPSLKSALFILSCTNVTASLSRLEISIRRMCRRRPPSPYMIMLDTRNEATAHALYTIPWTVPTARFPASANINPATANPSPSNTAIADDELFDGSLLMSQRAATPGPPFRFVLGGTRGSKTRMELTMNARLRDPANALTARTACFSSDTLASNPTLTTHSVRNRPVKTLVRGPPSVKKSFAS